MRTDKRREAVLQLRRRYERDEAHSRQVCKLALNLFDQLQSLHGLGSQERGWLEAAALLHDIGWSQMDEPHHKASLKLILQHGLPGWSEEETLVVANVARYHTKAPPQSKHRHFDRLDARHQETVILLAALLRLADGLDQFHNSSVKRILCSQKEQRVLLKLEAVENAELSLQGLEKKKDLFEEQYHRKIEVQVQALESDD